MSNISNTHERAGGNLTAQALREGFFAGLVALGLFVLFVGQLQFWRFENLLTFRDERLVQRLVPVAVHVLEMVVLHVEYVECLGAGFELIRDRRVLLERDNPVGTGSDRDPSGETLTGLAPPH